MRRYKRELTVRQTPTTGAYFGALIILLIFTSTFFILFALAGNLSYFYAAVKFQLSLEHTSATFPPDNSALLNWWYSRLAIFAIISLLHLLNNCFVNFKEVKCYSIYWYSINECHSTDKVWTFYATFSTKNFQHTYQAFIEKIESSCRKFDHGHKGSLTPDEYFNVLKLQNGVDITKDEVGHILDLLQSLNVIQV